MIEIGVIGAGSRGYLAKLAHRPEEGVRLAAVCDVSPAIREAYAAEFLGIAPYADYRDLLRESRCDAVFVMSPDFLHEEHALAALEAGLVVYLEKPMAITIEGCDRLLEAADRGPGRLYVGHNMRFFPVMREMKRVIDSGRIGPVEAIWCRHFIDYGGDAYFKDWHSERRCTTGLLLQKGAHDIDIIHWLAGSYTERTVAMGKLSVYNRVTDRRAEADRGDARPDESRWPPLSQSGLSPTINVEDHSMMLMQLSNGVQASYAQCHYTPDGYRSYTVIGREGRIENDGDFTGPQYAASVRVWTKRCGARLDACERIPVPPLEGSHGGSDRLIVDDFLRFFEAGVSEGATPVDARMSVAAGVCATRSLREGNRAVDVPGQDDLTGELSAVFASSGR